MRTSNKILLGLLVVVFSVPFLLATTLKSKMNKGEYTIVKNDNRSGGNTRSGAFTAFKVVKVIAPAPDVLTCHLKLSPDMNYKYYQPSKADSVIVFTANDTLFIQYTQIKTNGEERSDYRHTSIRINLPVVNNLVVDGAVVVIDSLPTSLSNLSVTLKNRGMIKDGTESREGEIIRESPGANIKKVKAVELPAIAKVESTSQIRKKEIETSALLPGMNFMDLLMFSLLCRI